VSKSALEKAGEKSGKGNMKGSRSFTQHQTPNTHIAPYSSSQGPSFPLPSLPPSLSPCSTHLPYVAQCSCTIALIGFNGASPSGL